MSLPLTRRFLIALGLIALGLGISFQAQAALHIAKPAQDRVPGEMIVKFKHSTLAPMAFTAQGFRTLAVEPFRTDSRLAIVRIEKNQNLDAAMQAFAAMDEIEYAEPNYILTALKDGDTELPAGTPNDAEFAKLWGLSNFGQTDDRGQEGTAGSDVNVIPVWNRGHTGSHDITVAVIDTGVEWNHEDLAANIWTNPGEAGELANNGVDDDGNGFIDDVHGWNFITEDNQSQDDNSHGTHCSGTIGGVANNGVGVAGVAWNVSIIPIKFLSGGGSGTLADAVESIKYATILGVDIMSNSWGGGGFTQSMFDAIVEARDAGILFIAAAGNSSQNTDASPSYPATYQVENVMSVAATDNRDQIATFSNYGRNTVHVAAPGVRVFSTVHNGGYDTYSGTSMATPHVAGAAALLKSVHPEWTYTEIKERLIKTSDYIRGLRRSVIAKGRINVEHALLNIEQVNPEPDENAWQREKEILETPHPYENATTYEFEIGRDGAKHMRLHFEKVDVEAHWDKIELFDGEGNKVETISGSFDNFTSDYVDGSVIRIKFVTDSSVDGWGFKMSEVHAIYEEE